MYQPRKSATDCTELIRTSTAYEIQSYITFQYNPPACKHNQKLPIKEKNAFKTWSFGIHNIRSGKEKDDAKMYLIAKELVKVDLSFCCLQKLKCINSAKKLLHLTAVRTMNSVGVKLRNAEKLELGFSYQEIIL